MKPVNIGATHPCHILTQCYQGLARRSRQNSCSYGYASWPFCVKNLRNIAASNLALKRSPCLKRRNPEILSPLFVCTRSIEGCKYSNNEWMIHKEIPSFSQSVATASARGKKRVHIFHGHERMNETLGYRTLLPEECWRCPIERFGQISRCGIVIHSKIFEHANIPPIIF